MSGQEKTIKAPKMLKIVQTFLARVQEVCLPDSLLYFFYIVNKVVKKDLKITKIWVKCSKVSDIGPEGKH